MVAPQQQLDTRPGAARARGQEPAASLAQLQASDGKAQGAQHLAQYLILLHHLLLSTLRPGQLRQVLVVGQFARGEGLALVVEQGFVTPARHRQLFFQADHHLVGPHPAHFGVGDPRHLLELGAHRRQVDAEEARRHVGRDTLLYRLLADVAEVALHVDLGDRPVGVRHQPNGALVGTKPGRHQQHRPQQALEATQAWPRQARRYGLVGHQPAGTTRHRLATAGNGLLLTYHRALHGY
ncbi:hypothetical protein D3C71_1442080 [compost metagenome]